ncbi:MAG: hypothetical protein LBK25_00215 [Treponema sp.]|nr:hypothetical protein [Treponema sp.]
MLGSDTLSRKRGSVKTGSAGLSGKYVYVKELDTESARIKRRGFLAILTELGVEDAKQRIFHTSYSLEGGRDAARKILQVKPRPSAVVCGEDLTAVGVVKEFIAAGFPVSCRRLCPSRLCRPKLSLTKDHGVTRISFRRKHT